MGICPNSLKHHAIGRAAAALAITITLNGCIALRPEERAARQREPDEARYRVVVEGPRISANALAGVDIVNPKGPVRVIVDPSLRRAAVDARPIPRNGADRRELERLREALAVSAESYVDDVRNVLRVRSAYRNPDENARIELTVYIPSCGGVMIRNADGHVELIGVSGDINVHSGVLGQTPGGSIMLVTETPVHGPLKLATTSGNIDIVMPSTSSGEYEVSTSEGRVQMQLIGGAISHSQSAATRWTGILNKGVHLCQVETMRGNVRVRLVDAPIEYRPVSGMAP
ncbi:MAG: DUF4097 family beta strand repeat protein [Phycisphaeraceae bacterium]|nr:DUF4097 family beta strand repeat protein [Phycisphaeraceae bacterium]